jgi:hypothetical protein
MDGQLHASSALFSRKYSPVPVGSMLAGSLVTTKWSVLRLRMEETASRYGG